LKKLKKYDFLVAGSGFGGSIMAMCLAKSGFEVCLVEKGSHPRFAIGESSTPIADMILRDLSEQYDIPFLNEISRYGEWQKNHPEVVCGLKRGFSYYKHNRNELFESDRNHSRELLVAASTDDENSDTNWLRSDVDHFLVQQVKSLGIDYFDHTEITSLQRMNGTWKVQWTDRREKHIRGCNAKWIVDATGSPEFSKRFFGTDSSSSGFHTNSSAIYSHFEDAGRWFDYLKENGFYTDDYPYNPDQSALHQLIDEGWIWMLRFNNDLLSAGIVMDHSYGQPVSGITAEVEWNRILSTYPSVKQLFDHSVISKIPGKLIHSGRLQRRLNRTFGEGWAALNHTAGFVDAFHSTGIAFTLSGVERLLQIFNDSKVDTERIRLLKSAERSVFLELDLIDKLVSSCYLSRSHFGLFSASVMLYFAATIGYEQRRLSGLTPETFLCAGDGKLKDMIAICHKDLQSWERKNIDIKTREAERLIRLFRERIAPYNRVGLMDDDKFNMYHHTAVVL
jgi:tetracycline 7-halogenase / FADH2 O2-dependent halogenase